MGRVEGGSSECYVLKKHFSLYLITKNYLLNKSKKSYEIIAIQSIWTLPSIISKTFLHRMENIQEDHLNITKKGFLFKKLNRQAVDCENHFDSRFRMIQSGKYLRLTFFRERVRVCLCGEVK